MSTHNLCFRAKLRKNVYPCKSQFYYIKVGCKGVSIMRTCYPDGYDPKLHTKHTPKTLVSITKTHKCNTLRFFKDVKIIIF